MSVLQIVVSIVASYLLCISHCSEIDNAILNYPQIDCEIDSLRIHFETKNPFMGKVYVKGQSKIDGCFSDYSAKDTTYQNGSGRFTVMYGTCNVQRDRSINPRGVFLRTTVVVQFHTVFTTKVDRAYRINCFYQEAIRTVNVAVDVSMMSTVLLRDGFATPQCSYTIRQNSFDGPPVTFVKVGDLVVHRWVCVPPVGASNDYPYGMLVHSCYVNDGGQHRELVVDDKGCSLDPYILGHLLYSEDMLTAYKEAHAFKFADQTVLYFSCQIRLCMKSMDSCRGMTPPKCLPLKNRRSLSVVDERVGSSGRRQNIYPNENSNVVDVHSDRLFVFDSTDDAGNLTFALKNKFISTNGNLCVSSMTSSIVSVFILLLYLCVVLITFFAIRRNYAQRDIRKIADSKV